MTMIRFVFEYYLFYVALGQGCYSFRNPLSLKSFVRNHVQKNYFYIFFLIPVVCAATEVVTLYVFHEPSLLSSLQDRKLTDVILEALVVKEVLFVFILRVIIIDLYFVAFIFRWWILPGQKNLTKSHTVVNIVNDQNSNFMMLLLPYRPRITYSCPITFLLHYMLPQK